MMKLDMPATRAALDQRVGAPLGLGVEQAAEGILTVTNANLGAAIRLSLFEKGLDPREFCLLSFGGAGGLHATEVAGELGMTEVAFPREPGTLSAYGILFSDLTQDIARSRVMRAEPASLVRIIETIAALRAEADARLAADGIAPDRRRVTIAADMRYHGQAFELLVPWGEVAAPDAGDLAALVEAFHAMHRQRFSYANPGDPVEIVTLRAIATGLLDKPDPGDPPPADRPARKGTRRAYETGAWRDIPVWDREALGAADTIEGPAIVEEAFATHWIARGWTARLGAAGTLIARKDAP
jgi:N-methylhydantoinase A/oxoprolinase/acetone carboxylase beta subunit